MSPLFELDSEDERNLKGLPYVVVWFEKAKEAAAYDEDNIRFGHCPLISVCKRKLSAIYQFVQAMPMLFVPATHTKVDRKKRKRETMWMLRRRKRGLRL